MNSDERSMITGFIYFESVKIKNRRKKKVFCESYTQSTFLNISVNTIIIYKKRNPWVTNRGDNHLYTTIKLSNLIVLVR